MNASGLRNAKVCEVNRWVARKCHICPKILEMPTTSVLRTGEVGWVYFDCSGVERIINRVEVHLDRESDISVCLLEIHGKGKFSRQGKSFCDEQILC